MNIVDIINKKAKGLPLTKEEINYLISSYMNGTIKDYQMSSLLMAIRLKGMTDEETSNLTYYMLNSGAKMNLSELDRVVDKHSTGGVGDKTTLIISPIVASCGVNVAKMSGRGLGHTGGTIDKLESIPGFVTKMTTEDFINQVKEIGLAITSQTDNLVPADKKIYALRDVTGTVESLPLIASSIMSKKIASGAKNLVLDVKVGSGALIKNLEDAQKLAQIMIKLGTANGMKVVCLLTNMDIPLGSNVGNSLEVEEAIAILKDSKKGNLYDICLELSSHMVSLGLNISYEKAKIKVLDSLNTGRAYNKFLEFIAYQKGNINNLPQATHKYEIKSAKKGYITDIDALKLGLASMHLGAGRLFKEDTIDYSAGIVLNKNINDYVEKGETLLTAYTSKENLNDVDFDIFKFSDTKVEEPKLIYEIVK